MVKKISDLKVQEMFPKAVYERGLNYFKEDQVSDLSYDINNDVWTAVVHGTEDYFVEIDLKNVEHGTIKAYCECPAFEAYDSCKHNVAVLLSIKAHESKRTSKNNYRKMDQFIEAITSIKTSSYEQYPQQIPLKVEYYCKWTFEQHLYLELKVGANYCLVVKDVEAFLNDVRDGREHYFTKTFTYQPEIHYFLKQDQEIFDMIRSMLNNEEIFQDSIFVSYQQRKNKRYVTISPLMIEPLLEKLQHRNFTVEWDGTRYTPIEILKDTLPFNFSITRNNQNELMLNLSNAKRGIYLKLYQIFFMDGTFYIPNQEQVPVLENISQIVRRDTELPVSKNQSDIFLSEVIPSLEKIGHIHLTEDVAKEIVKEPLRAKIFLEAREHLIVGELKYQYGAYEVNPFTGQREEEIYILRDIDKERHIMNLIEYANFRYNGEELYIDPDEEELYDFLYKTIPLMDQEMEVYLSGEVRNYVIDHEASPKTHIQVNSHTNLLEVGFSLDDVNDEEINEIILAIIEKKRYYRMRSGAMLSLENEEFSSMKQLFDEMDIDTADIHHGKVELPIYKGVYIDEVMQTEKQYDASFQKLLQSLRSPEQVTYEVPKDLQASLRDYQKTGYQWFKSLSHYQLGGILADDMGLGKTIQSIAYILSEPSNKPHLIIAPSSVVYNWKNECKRFAPTLSVATFMGTPEERKALIDASANIDVWITSYATLRQDIKWYKDLSFETLILDEAQYIKNHRTKTSAAIRLVHARGKFALSGTPIENSIDELWSIFQVILPGLMPSLKQFRQMDHAKVARLTKPFILRRLKEDVLKELPEKTESVHISDLTKDQKDLYVGYLRRLQEEASKSIQSSGFQQSRMKILAGLTRLRQICCHPSLFAENYEGKSGKLEQLMELVKNAIEHNKRMLIFSQFTSMHEIIMKKLDEEGIGYFYLHGQTSSEDRVLMSERFNNGENDVFLISLRAGGTGLNLTGADTVILYDLWWNPAVEDQATGRAHRFGQKNVVQVIRLITQGTIEEKIYDLQQEKRELIDKVIQPGETMISSLSEDDIRQLLNI